MIRRLTDANERAQALSFLASRLDTTPRDLVWTYAYEIMSVTRKGRIIGAMLFINWHGRSVEVHLAGDEGWMSRRVVKCMCAFAFEVLGSRRLVGLIRADNTHARSAAERIGFECEGIAQEADADGGNIAVYALLQRKCRWLTDGQEQSAEVRRSGSGCGTNESQPAGVWS